MQRITFNSEYSKREITVTGGELEPQPLEIRVRYLDPAPDGKHGPGTLARKLDGEVLPLIHAAPRLRDTLERLLRVNQCADTETAAGWEQLQEAEQAAQDALDAAKPNR